MLHELFFYDFIIMNQRKQNKKYNKQDKYEDNSKNINQSKIFVKDKSYSDLVSEIAYLKNRISGLITYGNNLNELNIELGKRFEKLQSYIDDKYIQPEIKKLTDENKNLSNELEKFKQLNQFTNSESELEMYKKRCSELVEINNFLRVCVQELEQKNECSSNYGYITFLTFIFIIISLILYSLIN